MLNKKFFLLKILPFLLITIILAGPALAQKGKSSHALGLHSKKRATQKSENTWFFGLGGGLNWVALSRGYTTVYNGALVSPPSNLDYYTVKTPAAQSQLQSTVGYRWHRRAKYFPYLSGYFQYRHYFPTHIKGSIEQYSLSDFENYDYRMSLSADLLTLNAKVNLIESSHVLPYLALGLGGIFNYLQLYQEFPKSNVTARNSPSFGDHTDAGPVLTLGLGLDFKATKNWWVSLGYELLFQGSLSTQNGTVGWGDSHLVFSNDTKMNTIYIQITANIPEGFQE